MSIAGLLLILTLSLSLGLGFLAAGTGPRADSPVAAGAGRPACPPAGPGVTAQ